MHTIGKSKKIAVIGAGGKMGSGIALLLLSALSKKKGTTILTLIDQDEESLMRLKKYLKEQLKRESERSIIELRELYKSRADLIENHDIVQYHVDSAFDAVFFGTSLEEAKDMDLLFEAVFEEMELKKTLLRKLGLQSPKALILSNTSSIPIHYLEEQAELKGRIAGFHFYNPPAVQKLVEIIVPKDSRQELITACQEIAKELGKSCVVAKDAAGFIGNGIFMREILFTLKLVPMIVKEEKIPEHEAIVLLDMITKTFLFRPMGIFQLTDYVGLDVAVNVFGIMSHFLEDKSIESPLLKKMLSLGKKGGHQGDSGQREGFFRYHDGEPEAVFDAEAHAYIPIEGFKERCLKLIGSSIAKAPAWKTLTKEKDAEKKIEAFYARFLCEETLGAELTLKYLLFEKDISFLLVKTGVAKNIEDISSVLKLGFYHLYGPDAPFLGAIEANFVNKTERYIP